MAAAEAVLGGEAAGAALERRAQLEAEERVGARAVAMDEAERRKARERAGRSGGWAHGGFGPCGVRSGRRREVWDDARSREGASLATRFFVYPFPLNFFFFEFFRE